MKTIALTPQPATLRAARMSRGGFPGAGRVIGGLVAAFLLVDGLARMAGAAPYVEGLTRFGFDAALGPWIGLALVASTALYLVPRTAVLGAVLLAGYLGGAAAVQVQAGDPWFLFPVALAALAWGGLWLRDARVRALLPLRPPAD